MTLRSSLFGRLALTRYSLLPLACAIAFLSCEVPVSNPTDPAHQVVQVIVLPDTATLDPAQHLKFTAHGRTASGDSSALTVSWSATGGSIAPDGMFVADTAAGDFLVSGTNAALKLSASSSVHIRRRPVATVSVSPPSATVTAGQTFQLAATPRDANGNTLSGRAVTWASSSSGVATVSAGGLVTGVAAGSATITATSEGKSGTATVSVTPAPVASVTVTPSAAALAVGETAQITATPRDANGNALSGRTVTWATSNAAVATVNGNGLVTGVAAGSATITATSEGKSATAAVTVTQTPVAVASVSVSPASGSVATGQTLQLTATPRDANGNALSGRVVTWGSSNTAAATVNGTGLVSGVATGTATISATSEGKSGTSGVTVTPVPVASVSVTPASASVTAGQMVQLTATVRDAAGNVLTGRVVTWGSSNTAAATVNGSGLVTGVAAGSATISATSEGQTGTAALTVTPVPVASVSVTPTSASVTAGQTIQLAATEQDASGNVLSGRVVTWSSSNTSLATVSASGLVRGMAAGSVTITATSEGKTGTAAVTVTLAPVASVSVTPASAIVTTGQTVQLTATLRDAGGNILTGRVVTWGSNNTGVATVNGNGLVSALTIGLAAITATCEGKSDTSNVTVTVPTTGGRFPLHVEAGKRYLVDAQGNPFLLQGDAAWSLIVQLTNEQADQYLEDRRQKGFNTVLVNLIEHKFSTNPPKNAYGDAPFSTPGDFSTPNEAYFAHAAYVINLAAQKGMLVLLAPAYMGVGGGDEGWYQEMAANGATKLANYGTYVANRFRAYDNILWVHGGDYDPPDLNLLRAIPNAIRAVDPKWLHTFHGYEASALGVLGTGEPWLQVNDVYTYTNLVANAFQEYQRSSMPFFLIESRYENESGAGEVQLRTQAYQLVLSGAMGQVMGNTPIWRFDTGWQQALDSRGARTLSYLPPLLASRAWWTLVPDISHTVLTAGVSSGTDQAATARASDGSFVLAYLPSARAVTVDLTKLNGPNVVARWYDPANGTYASVAGSPFAASGTRVFTPASTNSSGFSDWVLVLESSP